MRNASLTSDVPNPITALDEAAARVWSRAGAVDEAAAFPRRDVADLIATGIVAAIATRLDASSLPWLRAVGGASLTVGRLIEGHVNAAKLIDLFGNPNHRTILQSEARDGRLLGVWNAERADGVVAVPIAGGYCLHGSKIRCSGAGTIRRPLVTARLGEAVLIVLPDMTDPRIRVDLSVWRASGMRGTATGDVNFNGVEIPGTAVVGSAGDYYRSPWFSGGAWRVIAVQLGGLDRIMALHAARLNIDDAAARGRFAAAAGAHEGARLLVAEAARRAESGGDPGEIDAYVDLARVTFEAAALCIVEATRRNIGLSTFIAPDPLDRCLRDLETYLRQPFLDASRDNCARWLAARRGHFA